MQPKNIQVYLQLAKIILEYIYDVILFILIFKTIFVFYVFFNKSFAHYSKHFHQVVKMLNHYLNKH